MVNWPAIIKYAGDDELSFVQSLEELNKRPDLRGSTFNPGDVLIDATGKVYRPHNGSSRIEFQRESGEILTLDAVVDLVRRHASICGECCIGKISAPSITEAIALVRDLAPR
jgi:hypothetical protein